MNWYMEVLKKYTVFDGRAGREEYWYFVLFNLIATIILAVIDNVIGTFNAQAGIGVLGTIYALGVLLPSLAVTARRLHDTGRSGWWMLIAFIPILGFIVLIVFMIQKGNPGSNQYGEYPG